MTNEEKKDIRKIQSVLQQIQNGQKPFFNVTFYQKHGLINVRKEWRTDAVGNQVQIGSTFTLTEKAKRYLNLVI